MRLWPDIECLPAIRARQWQRAAICALASISFGTPADAETVTMPTQAAIVTPLSLVKSGDMIFGNIAMPLAAGTVVLAPASTCTTTGGLVRTGICQAASFSGKGSANQVVKVNLPNFPITISNGTQTMSITNRTFDAGTALNYLSGNVNGNGAIRYRIVPASGIFTFRLGGTLNVGANQHPGTYTGTFSVSLDYQ